MRGVRRVRLALINERRVGVRGAATAVGTGHDRAAGQHHEPQLRRQIIGVAEDVVGPRRSSGSSALQRHEHRAAATVGDLVETMVEELAEDREQRVERRRQPDIGRHVGDVQRLVRRNASAGRPVVATRRRRRRSSHGTTPSLPCDRTGNPAAATAAGFADVWSTIRLLTMRGWESKTFPAVCVYDVGNGRTEPRRRQLSVPENRRRQPRERLVGRADTSPARGSGCCTSRRRCADRTRAAGSRSGSGRSRSGHRTGRSPTWCGSPTWHSAILICCRMNARSAGVTVNPSPTTLAACAVEPRPMGSKSATMARAVVEATYLTRATLLRPGARS